MMTRGERHYAYGKSKLQTMTVQSSWLNTYWASSLVNPDNYRS